MGLALLCSALLKYFLGAEEGFSGHGDHKRHMQDARGNSIGCINRIYSILLIRADCEHIVFFHI